jgi:hypothetical protein
MSPKTRPKAQTRADALRTAADRLEKRAARYRASADRLTPSTFGEGIGEVCRTCWSKHFACLDCGAPACACDGHDCHEDPTP